MNDLKPPWVIEPGDPFGKEVGFTPDLFDGYISRVEEKKEVYISMIISKNEGKGNLSKLIKNI